MRKVEVCLTHNYEEVFDLEFQINIFKKLTNRNKRKSRMFAAFSLSLVNPNLLRTYLTLGTIKDVCPNFDGSIESLIPPELKNADLNSFMNDKVDLNLLSDMLGSSKGRLILFGAICCAILMFNAIYDLFYRDKKKNPKKHQYQETNFETVMKEILIIFLSLAALFLPILMF